jgi:hypothetical protein
MTEEKFKKEIEGIDNNPKLEKKYLINDLIKIRVHSLLKSNPPECGYLGCNLPIDNTTLGWDTSCPYHRLLFDYWLYNIVEQDIDCYTKQGRRSAFTQWVNKTGKERCDEIVEEYSHIPINWTC